MFRIPYDKIKKRENTRRWQRKNREKYRKMQREYSRKKRLEMKLEIFELLGNECVRCGFSDVRTLQIDHVHGGKNLSKKRRHRSGSYTYYREILQQIKAGSKDYQLLCANCNWIKRWENKEFPQRITEKTVTFK